MSVRVVARIRPLLPRELEKDIIVRAESSEEGGPVNVVKIPSPKNDSEFSFAFNGVYDQSTSQEALFNAEVAPHVKALFQGLDLTLFAYGVTGTGKTHTMRGGLKLADRGVIPRLLSHVFRRAKKMNKDADGSAIVTVALSYYEIYNDKVYDLLEPPEKRTPSGLPLREKDNRTFVIGLSEQPCVDLHDFERLYIAANQNRVTAATKLNAHSSRSHAILRVKVTQTTLDDDGVTVLMMRESTASAIDLAGSEDNRRTENDRQRLVESAAINKSLFVLSQCVDAISRGEKRIPFRESKMTRILSLGQNNGITVMILNLAPIRSYHLDTLSSLNVSSRAKRIEVREIENEVVFKQPPRSMSNLTSSSTSNASASSAAGLARQPLRALTSNTHNIQTGVAAAAKATAEKPDKPIKAFSVYTDRIVAKPPAAPAVASIPPPSHAATAPRMGALQSRQPKSNDSNASNKRTADAAEHRPSKLARPTVHAYSAASLARTTVQQPAATPAAPVISAADIEKIVERKVAEALAARAQEEAQALAQKQPAVEQRKAEEALETQQHADASESMQKRLDALERRIDSTHDGDERTEGLRYLLLARQHREAGDDAATLRCYEQALPFFPGQAKLLGKIEKLRVKMAIISGASDGSSALSPRKTRAGVARESLRKRASHCGDSTGVSDHSEYYHEAESDADAEDDDAKRLGRTAHRRSGNARSRGATSSCGGAGRRKAKDALKESKTGSAVAGLAGDDADDEAPLTPRKKHLLDIVNSRDVARIRSLAGVGAKKARDLVAYLDGHEDREDASHDVFECISPVSTRRIGSLAELRNVPGMGGRTVERACAGLVV
ncbi:kinesin family protein [Grosmannia clavigera kw1407]|uniref:Kinesin family protein n=1 Tax=Grosmannia clavigera (strain kw1407 / UAMH 11150) TaxID=655863 RepID=F0X8T3_GROCL|nr:kinesin family protein [Grosmannia clavigera kw1407]EFX05205.1 kinesin family protein [Grosmannia clavigera kw1407]